jgi:sigma-B regulation protein RsbU (phosphoserine phosphatase)
LKSVDRFNRLYDFYTSDLSYKEIEKLIKRDIPELYNFYVRKMKNEPGDQRSPRKFFKFLRALFVEFLQQLTPVRRLLYTISIILFFYGFMSEAPHLIFLGFLLLNLLLAFELADKLVAKDELAIAREVQIGLMPKEPPINKFYDISCYSEAAREVGGDYFDFITNETSPETLYTVIGDISGKGMAAALHMAQVQAVLHNLIGYNNSPKEILTLLNDNFIKIFKKGSFFTTTLACITQDGSIVFSRAGHTPLLHYSMKQHQCCNIIPKGMGIGLSNNHVFENSLEEIKIRPESGDILVFYTDGVVEAMNEFMQEYGEGMLKNVIINNAGQSAKRIQELILENISYFIGPSPAHDDLTFIVMKAV